jgi:hypothetical protein
MDSVRDKWLEKRLDRLEKRIDGVYWTIYWVMLIVFAALYTAGLIIAAQG